MILLPSFEGHSLASQNVPGIKLVQQNFVIWASEKDRNSGWDGMRVAHVV